MKLSIELPEELNISDRSRKFWDDKYEFNDNGFTDDDGVYRSFDCYDKDARAPTPLPPIYLMKCVKEDGEQDVPEETTPASKQSTSATPASDQVETSGRAFRRANRSALAPTQESSSTSPLSDCPSDLSDWELSNKTKKSSTKIKDDKEETEETRAETPTPSKTKPAAKRSTTTRGVAQKVKKQPAKKGKAAAAAPVVLERKTGGGTARRRSGR